MIVRACRIDKFENPGTETIYNMINKKKVSSSNQYVPKPFSTRGSVVLLSSLKEREPEDVQELELPPSLWDEQIWQS